MNYFGLSTNSNGLKGLRLGPGQSDERKIDILANVATDLTKLPDGKPPFALQTAIRCNLDEFYFVIPVMFCVLFEPKNAKMGNDEYQNIWRNIQTTNDMCANLTGINAKYQYPEAVKIKF